MSFFLLGSAPTMGARKFMTILFVLRGTEVELKVAKLLHSRRALSPAATARLAQSITCEFPPSFQRRRVALCGSDAKNQILRNKRKGTETRGGRSAPKNALHPNNGQLKINEKVKVIKNNLCTSRVTRHAHTIPSPSPRSPSAFFAFEISSFCRLSSCNSILNR